MQTTEWNFWANLFMLAQFMMILLVGMRVMLTRHPPGSSFAWLLITAALPVAGFLLYLFIGERPLARFRLLRVKRLLEHYYPWAKDRLLPYGPMPLPLNEYEPLLRLSTNLARLPLTVGNRVTLLPTSLEAFERILEDIRKAERQIELAYYIWESGAIVDDIEEALADAARRGVSVRILCDDFGSSSFLRSPRREALERAGVKIWRVLPIRFGNFRMSDRIDLRYHRKLVIIDEKVAYTGSLNMIAPKSAASGAAPQERWIDAMIRIEGPGTVVLSALWEGDCGLLSNCDENRDVNAYMELFTNGRHEQPGDVPMVCVHSGPYGNEDASLHLILRVISSARRSLTIVTPYFVPTETIVSALLNAASTNVRVRIIVPRLCDSRIVTWGGRRFFEELLDAGIEIYFFEDGMLHTKAITVDDEVSVFGTVNIDTRSLHLNFEHSMLIINRAFTAQLNGLFAGYFAGSFRLDPALWKKRGLLARLREGFSYLASPLF